MSEELETLKSEYLDAARAAASLAALDEVRVRALGKKGAVTQRMKSLGGLDPEARKEAGQALNQVRRRSRRPSRRAKWTSKRKSWRRASSRSGSM